MYTWKMVIKLVNKYKVYTGLTRQCVCVCMSVCSRDELYMYSVAMEILPVAPCGGSRARRNKTKLHSRPRLGRAIV